MTTTPRKPERPKRKTYTRPSDQTPAPQRPRPRGSKRVAVDDFLPTTGNTDLIADIVAGLRDHPRRISSMFFYDALGSELFEEITRLPEYYPTRTEKGLLHEVANSLSDTLNDIDIVELGSGDCSKISILLDAIKPDDYETVRYVPLDVSKDAIQKSADILAENYPDLTIHGIVADFMTQLHLIPHEHRRLLCFFGSTIGNLSPQQRTQIFDEIARSMNGDDVLILGVDLVKPPEILERAYNDSSNVTASFNRNILNVVNEIAETDFDTDAFKHVALFNADQARIEMHLEAREDVQIRSPHLPEPLDIQRGERIHTENSHKFTPEKIAREARAAGLKIDSSTTDPNNWFAVMRLSRAS